MSQHDRYISPFSTRYASDEMQYIFSDDNKFRTWRRLWVALARAEMKQGLTNITPEMVAELEAHVDDINYEVAIEREKLVRHDVMSHVYAYGQQCLISGKHLLCKVQTDCLCSLSGKTVFCNIGWIVADNVVVTFDIFTFLIFVKMSICQFTFLVKRHRITVQSIHIKLFS